MKEQQQTSRLVMYSRTYSCPYLTTARRVLAEHAIDYEEIFIDRDPDAMQRVLHWTGFQSIPTLIIAKSDTVLPLEEPEPLPPGSSPRGIDRGYMLTEASASELRAWLRKHGILNEDDAEQHP